MYEILKQGIKNGYELVDMLEKIDTMWVQSRITNEQRVELIGLAREKADPTNSYAPTEKLWEAAIEDIADLKRRMTALERGEHPVEPEIPTEEYPEFVMPTGAHDAYHVGDKITYNGVKYVCKMDGCVWAPDTYPQGWEVVTEEV